MESPKFNIRLTPEDKEVLTRAANKLHLPLATFMRMASMEKAEQLLVGQVNSTNKEKH